LMFLMGAGPLIAWRKASLGSLWRTFRVPFFSGSIITAIFLILDSTRVYAAVSFGLALFVIATIEAEFRRATKARSVITSSSPMQSAVKMFARSPQKWGGFLVHLGVAVMCISITASMAYKIEKDFTLKTGEKLEVGKYELELVQLSDGQSHDYSTLSAEIAVRRAGELQVIGTLRPEKRFYPRTQQSTTEVDIRMTMIDDLYIALAGLDMSESEAKTMDLVAAKAAFKVFINPLQVWLWVGALVVLMGTMVVLRPLFVALLGRDEIEIEVEISEARARG
ncbi:MAG: cytochrome c-type biogenesis CcmF C-terminal domain-containing protein, partial [bacterium]|nr:cytochrome c-type biogenesis CcmF C-terminal domain-containing protein [bacterium]